MKFHKNALAVFTLFSIHSFAQTFPNDGYSRPYTPITPAPIFIQGPPNQANMLIRQLSNGKNNTYILPATPSTTNWGYFDAGAPPALTIKSGDTVIIETLPAGGGQVPPGLRGLLRERGLGAPFRPSVHQREGHMHPVPGVPPQERGCLS